MSLLDDVSIVVTPNGYKAGELYAVIPVPTEGAEILSQPVDLQTDFVVNSGGVIVDADTFTSSGGAFDGIKKSGFLTIGKRYKLIIEGTTTSSGFTFGILVSGNEYGSGFGTHYFTATTQDLWIRQQTSGTTNITSFSIKEYTSADMDVTRATAATRVDENGLVNYAEIIGDELVTNGDFELNSDWNNFSTPTTSEQSTEQSHTGTYSWKVIADATQEGIFSPNNFSITNGNSYSVSLWIYSVSGNSIKSGLNNTNVSVFTERTVIAGQWTNINYEATATSTGASYISILSQNSLQFFVDNVSVKELTRDNVPRIDYTGGGCPHILAEPQRTNLIKYSSDFSNAIWTKSGSSVTLNATTSPDGTINADKLVEDTSTGGHQIQSITSSSNSTIYTTSVFVKYAGREWIRFTDAQSSNRIHFNTLTGVFGTVSGTVIDYNKTALENGWYKLSLTTTSVATAYTPRIALAEADNDVSYTGDGVSGVYIYGCSLEEGSYPTSLIPTSGGTVTRNKDIFTRDGIGGLINDSEGVLFVEMAALSDDGTLRCITLSDGGTTNRVLILYNTTSNSIRAVVVSTSTSGGTSFDEEHTVTSTLDFHKIAIKWKLNDFALWIDGDEVATDTSGAAPVGLDRIVFDVGNGTYDFFGKVKQLQVYNTALTDEQLLQLTGESGTDFYESYAEMASALTYTIQ